MQVASLSADVHCFHWRCLILQLLKRNWKKDLPFDVSVGSHADFNVNDVFKTPLPFVARANVTIYANCQCDH